MRVLTGINVTESMLGSGTSIAEPSTGETVWADATAYVVGDEVILTSTHRVYKCAAGHTSAPATRPDLAPDKWVDIAPTQRFAPFDMYVSTAAKAADSIVYEITPDQYTGTIMLFGVKGVSVKVEIVGGSFEYFTELFEAPDGWFEYLFLPSRPIDRVIVSDLPFSGIPKYRITVLAPSATAEIGMIVVGELIDLMPSVTESGKVGGVTYGAVAEPASYSYIKTNDDGTTQIVRRHSSTNLRCTAVLPQYDADRAAGLLHDLLDRPSAWIPSRAAGYKALTVYGLLSSAPVTYSAKEFVTIEFDIRGMI